MPRSRYLLAALTGALLGAGPSALASQGPTIPAAASDSAPATQQPAARDTAAQDTTARDTTPAAPAGAPVVVKGDTLFRVLARHGSFTREERAAAIEARLRRLSRAGADSLVLSPGETATEILAGETVLMTVTDADAAAAGRPRDSLAAEFRVALSRGLQEASLQATIRAVGRGILLTLVATGALVALLALLGRLFPAVYTRVEGWRRTRMPSIRIQSFEFLSADRVTDLLIAAARGVRIALVVILLYIYVPLVFSFFPWTHQLSGSLVGYVTTPLLRVGGAFIEYLPNVFYIAVIVVVTRFLLKLVRPFFGAIERGTVRLRGFEPEWGEPTYKIFRFMVIAFGLVVLFPYLPGSRSEAFRGVSLFLGLLLSLGSSSAVANVIAGVVLTYTRAFNVGDRVRIGDTMGDVIAKTLLVTRVRTIKNVDITIPNALVLSSHVHNYSASARGEGLILHTGVTIGYDAPWRQVHELLLGAARATPGILPEPVPFVLQTSLDDYYVSYQLNAYTDAPHRMAGIYSELHANIQDRFNEAGVEIMSPQYNAIRDGNAAAVPADHLARGYTPPAFRVQRVDGPSPA